MENTKTQSQLPRHIGFIVDGNRRWAKERGKRSQYGHRAGAQQLKEIAKVIKRKGIPFASAYIFSTENWKRAQEEVNFLMDLTIKLVERDLDELHQENIKIVHIGSREGVPDKVLKALDKAIKKTAQNTATTFGLCFNYGGQHEIIDAVKTMVRDGVNVDDITTEQLGARLYAPEVPSLDFIVRTSGENRLSNFMLWRGAYAELYFPECYWPDFTEEELDAALDEYARRQRRFGA